MQTTRLDFHACPQATIADLSRSAATRDCSCISSASKTLPFDVVPVLPATPLHRASGQCTLAPHTCSRIRMSLGRVFASICDDTQPRESHWLAYREGSMSTSTSSSAVNSSKCPTDPSLGSVEVTFFLRNLVNFWKKK